MNNKVIITGVVLSAIISIGYISTSSADLSLVTVGYDVETLQGDPDYKPDTECIIVNTSDDRIKGKYVEDDNPNVLRCISDSGEAAGWADTQFNNIKEQSTLCQNKNGDTTLKWHTHVNGKGVVRLICIF